MANILKSCKLDGRLYHASLKWTGSHCSGCHRFWQGFVEAHCTHCHEHFHSLSGMRFHRRNEACRDPGSIGMLDDGAGRWLTTREDAAYSARSR